MRTEFDRLNIIRQIKGTTGIEGNTLSEDRISEVLDASRSDSAYSSVSREEKEVLNAHAVLLFIKDTTGHGGSAHVTEDLIRTLHRLSTETCDYPDNQPGHYRQRQVTVGDYVPPEHQEVPDLMRRFLTLINSREAIEGFKAPIRAVLAHFYLISIHPFTEGNGRTSRALEAYMLYKAGYNVRGFYSLANYLYRHREEYIQKLQEARFKLNGDLTEFVTFCLHGFTEELKNIQDEILDYIRLILFQDMILEAHQNRQFNDRCYDILQYLRHAETKALPEEAFKNKQHFLAKSLYRDLTSKTILRDLQKLQAKGLISLDNARIVLNLAIMNEFV